MTTTARPTSPAAAAIPEHRVRVKSRIGSKLINWDIETNSLRFFRIRPLSKLFTWLEINTAPKMEGPRDLSDLFAPGQTHAANLPYYYLFNPVHGMSNEGLGWMHPRAGKRYESMARDFTYAMAENVRAFIERHVVPAMPNPSRILDLATATGVHAFVYADVYPNAEVVGTDLAPNFLRWAKRRAAETGRTNVRFYHQDAGDLFAFEDNSFDIVNEGMCLHEMPADWNLRVIREMIRVCKPGGVLAFSDWDIPENGGEWKRREHVVRVGQEPFMLEFSEFNFPKVVEMLGCDIERVAQSNGSAEWVGRKGPGADQLLAETASLTAKDWLGRVKPFEKGRVA